MSTVLLLDSYIQAYLLLIEALGKETDIENKKEIRILISNCDNNIKQAKYEINNLTK